MSATIFPTIHTNGTNKFRLLGGYSEARLAIFDAMKKVEAIEFNARDYYPQGSDAWIKAVAEYNDRFESLSKIADEIHLIMEKIDAQA